MEDPTGTPWPELLQGFPRGNHIRLGHTWRKNRTRASRRRPFPQMVTRRLRLVATSSVMVPLQGTQAGSVTLSQSPEHSRARQPSERGGGSSPLWGSSPTSTSSPFVRKHPANPNRGTVCQTPDRNCSKGSGTSREDGDKVQIGNRPSDPGPENRSKWKN